MSATASGVSPAKRRANQLNAQKSTGPRSEAGKARSSQNAVRHGIFCKDVVLPGEDHDEFHRVRHALLFDLRPEGALQQMFADRVVILSWKLKRITSAEADAHADISRSFPDIQTAAMSLAYSSHDPATASFERLGRYEQRLASQIHRALAELRRLQHPPKRKEPQPDAYGVVEYAPLHDPFGGDDYYRSPSMQNEPTETAADANREATATNTPGPTPSPRRDGERGERLRESPTPQAPQAAIPSPLPFSPAYRGEGESSVRPRGASVCSP